MSLYGAWYNCSTDCGTIQNGMEQSHYLSSILEIPLPLPFLSKSQPTCLSLHETY